MIDWIEDHVVELVIGFLIAAMIALVVILAIKEDKEWAQYSVEHHCEKKGIKKGQVATGFGPAIGGKGGVAVVTTVTPDQEIFVCDGGEIIIR